MPNDLTPQFSEELPEILGRREPVGDGIDRLEDIQGVVALEGNRLLAHSAPGAEKAVTTVAVTSSHRKGCLCLHPKRRLGN